ncbi:transposase [Streptomyces sp. NEAU-174]|uniref:transposase n=1 Tax=Streptomyces sp. NEAU-174 TaxID=3458254 RepID=UPI0040447E3E
MLGAVPVLPRPYGRVKTASQCIPGRPCSFVAVLEPGATSWTAVLDVVRLGPADEATAIAAALLRGVVERLIAAGQWQAGVPYIVIVSDAGYDVTRLAWVLRDLPVELAGRVGSDRVMRLPEAPGMHGVNSRPLKHGPELRFTMPETWPEPAITTDTTNDGQAEAQAGDRVRPRLTHRSSWLDHDGGLPLVEGRLMSAEGRASVEGTGCPASVVMVLCGYGPSKPAPPPPRGGPLLAGMSASLRSGAHLRLREADPGLWTTPETSYSPGGGPLDLDSDRRPTLLRLARSLAADLRRPWEKPTSSGRLTPARVRRGFRTTTRNHRGGRGSTPSPANPGPACQRRTSTACVTVGELTSSDTR